MAIERKLNLPDYFVSDDFILTFTQLLSYLSWLGIPWKMYKSQCIWSNTLLLSIAVCIVFTGRRMLVGSLPFAKSLIKFVAVTRYLHGFLSIVLIRRLRKKWHIITKAWTTGNHTLPGMRASYTTLRRNIFRIFICFAVCYALERLFLILAMMEIKTYSMEEVMDAYTTWSRIFLASTSWYVPYLGAPMAVLMVWSSAVATVLDFILVAFSMGLAARQERLNKVLKDICERDSGYRQTIDTNTTTWPIDICNSVGVWRKLREAFVRHSGLVALISDAIGPLIVLSVFTNFAYILMILVFGFNSANKDDVGTLSYYAYALTWCVLRCFMVVLKTSEVHNLSTVSSEYLKLCSTKSYNIEIRRLYFQLTKNEVALNGMGFFKMHRACMLKALSIIITYDLIILQYKDRLSSK